MVAILYVPVEQLNKQRDHVHDDQVPSHRSVDKQSLPQPLKTVTLKHIHLHFEITMQRALLNLFPDAPKSILKDRDNGKTRPS